jgi:hypothetical protein
MDSDARQQRIATVAKWGIGLAIAAGISPFIFFAVKGIIGLALAAAIGFVAIQLAPVFATKVANLSMRLLTAEAAANPIETMRNLYVEKSEDLERAGGAIEAFETEIRNFDDQVGTFKRDYPDEAAKYDELSEQMHAALADMKREQTQARKELHAFSQQIKKAEAIYKMALAANKVTKLSRSAEAKIYAQIKEQVALDSVRTQLNRAFAGLNSALERRAAAGALELPTPVAALPPKRKR